MDLAKKLLTPDEVAEFLAVTPQTVTALMRTGKMPGIRVGRAWRMHPDQLEAYIYAVGTSAYKEYAERMDREGERTNV